MQGLRVAPGTEAAVELVVWYEGDNPDGSPGDMSFAILGALPADLQEGLREPGRALIASAAWFLAEGMLAPDGDGNLIIAGS